MKKSDGMARRLFYYIGQQKFRFLSVFLLALVVCACEIAAPYFVGVAIDQIGGPGLVNFERLAAFIGLLAVFYLIDGCLLYVMNRVANITANRVVARLRQDAFDKLTRLPLKYYDTHPRGDVISRFTNDCDAVSDGLLQGTAVLFSGIVTIIGTASIMFYLSFSVTIAVIFATSITFVVAYFVSRFSHKSFQAQQMTIGELNGRAEEICS